MSALRLLESNQTHTEKIITALNFKDKNLSTASLLNLFKSLENNENLTELDLSYNKIEIVTAKALAKLLKKNNRINHLNLKHCEMNEESIEALIIALKSNTGLVKLDLSYNSEESRKTKAATRILAETLRQNSTLKSLNLRRTAFNTEILSQALSDNKGLTEIDLGLNDINGEALKLLTQCLENNQNLTHLGLPYNQIGNEDIPSLIQLLNRANPLVKLDLHHNLISNEGVQLFADFLATNTSLTSLDLTKNLITDAKASDAAWQAIKRNRAIAEQKVAREIQEITGIIPDLVKIITSYAGPLFLTQKVPQPPKPPPAPPSTLVPANPANTNPKPIPKKLFLFDRIDKIKNWLYEKWNKLILFIRKLGTRKTSCILTHQQNRPVKPEQTVQVPEFKTEVKTEKTIPAHHLASPIARLRS